MTHRFWGERRGLSPSAEDTVSNRAVCTLKHTRKYMIAYMSPLPNHFSIYRHKDKWVTKTNYLLGNNPKYFNLFFFNCSKWLIFVCVGILKSRKDFFFFMKVKDTIGFCYLKGLIMVQVLSWSHQNKTN